MRESRRTAGLGRCGGVAAGPCPAAGLLRPATAVTRRKSDPDGNPRGGQPANWPGNRTFLGGVDDSSTGLTHIGAREYEPSTGRFISVDPIIDITDPLQMNGYTYANGNPITNSDPSGLMIYEGMDSGGISSGGCGGCNIVNHPDDYHSIGFKSYYYPKDYDSYIEMGPVKVHYTSQKALDNAFAAVEKHQPNLFKKYNWVANCMYKDGRCNATSVPVLPYLSHVMCNMDGITCENSVDNIGYILGLGLYAELENGGELEKSINKIVFGGKPAARPKSKPDECKNSFVSGTRVLLADGTSKPIEELKPDDEVLATDPETGETTPETVTAAIRTEDDKEYVDLTIETTDGPQTITTTDHHPFWSETDREWRDAATLTPGTHLRTAEGKSVTLTNSRTYLAHLVTHNLTVAALHTYYVLAGAVSVLVHNCPPSAGSGVVEFSPPPNATAAEIQEVKDYVASCERARCAGHTAGGRPSTTGTLRSQASRSAAAERKRAAAAGTPYTGVVGHGPDTT
ncbi:polymorphic toxin-type HINT domain-containing protein [Streptomyces sp. 3211.6]|uniref:polymorphic toxin-type HINT domain-containing protein n=1 Tax=Streptomyces sp. 3211.6 TaxID=1938845 RepID=UPI001650E93A|nr:polymorphic toxin-type HINT domain-containing protein [Streptomyces sp. 3211.6]